VSAGRIRAVFFDLGGVLVELGGEEHFMRLLGGRVDLEEMWRIWLASPAVRSHETGRIGAEAFARAAVEEFALPVRPEEFLAGFRGWIREPYAGAHALLDEVSSRYRTGLLTNTSAFHWTVIAGLGITERVHHVVASHQVGVVKPDAEFFALALAEAGVEAGEALFLDDNQVNVAGALACGLDAARVRGAAGARSALVERGLLPR